MNAQRHNPRLGIAGVVAVVLLLAAGLAARGLTRSLADVSGSVPLPPGTLDGLPLTFGAWHGTALDLDDRQVAATDTEDHVFRSYSRNGGEELVKLFVAYGVRFRELLPHRPEVCYPGAGWSLDAVRPVDLALADGRTITARLFRFARGGLTHERISVLSYYLVDGVACADESRLREIVGARESAGYLAQIQIAARHPLRPRAADDMAIAFACDAAPMIERVLTAAVARYGRRTGP